MNVESVQHEMPTQDLWVGSHDGLDMGEEIGFRARGAVRRCNHLTGHDITAEDERSGAVPYILKLDPFDLIRRHGQTRVFIFQRLHTPCVSI